MVGFTQERRVRRFARPIVLNAFRRHGRIHAIGGLPRPRGRKCSTPFGVMVGFTLRGAGVRAAPRVLNAFRRHGRIHHPILPRAFGGWSVLNAFRRHGRIHTGKRLSLFDRIQVLNAFRRHGRIHDKLPPDMASRIAGAQRLSASWSDSLRAGLGQPPTASKCSTPFGVMVGFTLGRTRGGLRSIGAQRLSASWSDSRLPARQHDGRGVCSTPFGVMVGFTDYRVHEAWA